MTPTIRRSKTTDRTVMPPNTLDAALSDAEQLLAERARLFSILSATHETIPALLRARIDARTDVAVAEVSRAANADGPRAHLDGADTELAAAVRQRTGAIEALLSLEEKLVSALARVETARQTYAAAVIAEFQERYERTIQQLQTLWREGDTLARSLRTAVDMPLPVRLVGGTKANFLAAETSRMERVLLPEPSEVIIDPMAGRIGAVLDGLNDAVTYSKGLAGTLIRERFLPTRTSSRPFDANGVFTVLHSFRDPVDGLPYGQGALVDASLLGVASLQRFVGAKLLALELGSSGKGRVA